MNTSCPDSRTNYSQFVVYDSCYVSTTSSLILNIILSSLCLLTFFFEIGLLLFRWSKKPIFVIILNIWILLHTFIVLINPLVNISQSIYPSTSLALQYAVHLCAASAAGIVILFLYIELRIIRKSKMKRERSRRDFITMILLGITQFILFVITPLLSRWTSMTLPQAFWIPVIIIDFTLIPYFCFTGIVLYLKIERMEQEEYRRVSRRILTIVITCGTIGLFTGIIGIIALVLTSLDWILLPIVWMSDLIFNGIIFYIMTEPSIEE